MMRILVVCTANICRSPTAEAILRTLLDQAGLAEDITVDSAGTHANDGSQPDVRSRLLAEQRGYPMDGIRSRGLTLKDYRAADLILAMDKGHRHDMHHDCPLEHLDKIKLFLDFTSGMVGQEVPDPYRGDARDFQNAFELIERGAEGLVTAIKDQQPHLAYKNRA